MDVHALTTEYYTIKGLIYGLVRFERTIKIFDVDKTRRPKETSTTKTEHSKNKNTEDSTSKENSDPRKNRRLNVLIARRSGTS